MRGVPGLLTRRRVTMALAVVASGGVVTAAVAAGPTVYSEYTSSGKRENRLALADGAGDVRLPKTTFSASVSPDGRQIAQVGVTVPKRRSGRVASWLHVTAADGSAPVTILEHVASRAGQAPDRVIGGRPIWSPDGTQVLVQATTLDEGRDVYMGAERLVCTVATKVCRGAGRTSADTETVDGFDADIVAWQATDGPLRWTTEGTAFEQRVRCGAGARPVETSAVSVGGIPGWSTFGRPLRLRGVAQGYDGTVSPATVGVVAVADGTLAYDVPKAKVTVARLRCSGRSEPVSAVRTGLPRLRLRAGGHDVTLPTPPGLRRGTGLALVGSADGGALLISRDGIDGASGPASCSGRGPIRHCVLDNFRTYYVPLGEWPPVGRWNQRVWRYRPGSRRFERVTTASRAALQTLKSATNLAVADGDAVLAVTQTAIQRVPLDGGAPTTVASGSGIALSLAGEDTDD